MKHQWTRNGKKVKNTGKGKTVAQINHITISRINEHIKQSKMTPLQRMQKEWSKVNGK